MEICARRPLPVGRDEAFAFLSHPHNHRRLVTAFTALFPVHCEPFESHIPLERVR